MGFHDVLFPTGISYGSKGGPTFNTKVVKLVSGQGQYIPRWSAPQFRYDIAEGVKSIDDLNALITFYIARLGPANAFKYSDPAHFTTASNHRAAHTNADQVIAVGDGATTQFQLRKGYTSGAYTVWKNIYKPVGNTTLVAVNSVSKTEGVDFSVDVTTGIITFTVAPTNGHSITAGCQFYTPVRFEKEMDQDMLFNYEAYDISSLDSIMLIEDVNPTTIEEEYNYGGGANLTFSTPLNITHLTGRSITLTPASALTVYLPNPATSPLGGPHFVLYNTSAFTLTFKYGATTYFSLVGGAKCTVNNMLVSGVRTWIAF